MKDKNDYQTIDLINKPKPGRPKSSNPEKKKADAAARAKRYRESRKKYLPGEEIKNELFSVIQQLHWEENCYMVDGSFDPRHELKYMQKKAQEHRIEIAKNLIKLCELFDERAMAQRLFWVLEE